MEKAYDKTPGEFIDNNSVLKFTPKVVNENKIMNDSDLQNIIDDNKSFEDFLSNLKVPDSQLSDILYVDIKCEKDFNKIPKGGGCYWIATSEVILHSKHVNKFPAVLKTNDENLEIVYNGMAQDDIRGRIKRHLNSPGFKEKDGRYDAGQSGISVDILILDNLKPPRSHCKYLLNKPKSKTPYVKDVKTGDFKTIKEKSQMYSLSLSDKEKDYLDGSNSNVEYMKNGICVFEDKHVNHVWRVYYISPICRQYTDYIESTWRQRHGSPRLNTYISGR